VKLGGEEDIPTELLLAATGTPGLTVIVSPASALEGVKTSQTGAVRFAARSFASPDRSVYSRVTARGRAESYLGIAFRDLLLQCGASCARLHPCSHHDRTS
jgi:hypothetical protein